MAVGWAYEQVEAMPLFAAQMLFEYWEECPPVNEILAVVHGVKKPETRNLSVDEIKHMPTPEGYMSIEQLRQSFKDGGLKLVSDNG
jgi:hypothetical protein